MDRPSASRTKRALSPVSASFALALATLLPASGCLHLLLASGIYMMQGGNLVPADCDALVKKRVVVFCQAPASNEYRFAGASRQIAKSVSIALGENVKGIDIVPQQQVDQWLDENDSDDFEELGRAVKADLVVQIELGHFDLFKGKTVYQGSSDVTVNVYDMQNDGSLVWEYDNRFDDEHNAIVTSAVRVTEEELPLETLRCGPAVVAEQGEDEPDG